MNFSHLTVISNLSVINVFRCASSPFGLNISFCWENEGKYILRLRRPFDINVFFVFFKKTIPTSLVVNSDFLEPGVHVPPFPVYISQVVA